MEFTYSFSKIRDCDCKVKTLFFGNLIINSFIGLVSRFINFFFCSFNVNLILFYLRAKEFFLKKKICKM